MVSCAHSPGCGQSYIEERSHQSAPLLSPRNRGDRGNATRCYATPTPASDALDEKRQARSVIDSGEPVWYGVSVLARPALREKNRAPRRADRGLRAASAAQMRMSM